MITAIDPGTDQSAIVIYENGVVLLAEIKPNQELILDLMQNSNEETTLAIEMVACYGMAVGREVFETCVWIGRFAQAYGADKVEYVYRRDVKLHLCNSARAKDANIRQALLDKFPRTGGGKTPQVGTKKEPGALFGIKSHLWAALSVAVYFNEVRQ